MKLRQFFSYFGGKLRNSAKYPEPEHDTVIEPFCGGAGYSHLHYEKNVVLYDVYEPVVKVWEYLIQATREDILGLPLLSSGQTLSEFNLSPGERYFIGFWLARASATPRVKATSWMQKYPTRLWGEHVRRVIADQVHLINHWQVYLSSYTDIPDRKAMWFVDPPYQRAGKFYPEHTLDFDRLAGWCRNRTGQVVVCEEEGADWLPFKTLYTHKGIQRQNRNEVIWQNY